MRSPEPDGTGRRHAGVAGNLHAQYTTGVGMQPLAATAAQAYYGLGNYYPNNAQTNAGSVYYYPHAPQDGQQASAIAHAAQAVAAQAQAAQQAQAQAQQQQENSKKRSFEGVDQFFEDAKRHKLQPIYDGAMAQRLSALQFIPSSTSEGVDFNGAATVTAPATNGSTQTFTLPSLRTKQDLIDADNFLTQLSANVYDNSQQYQYRTNTSASPHTPNGQSHQGQDGQHDGAASASMANPVTQALTPPGSNYTTSHSPVHHSHAHTPPNVSPQSSAASMYPSLPATVSSAGVTGGYPAPVSSAPTSSLASAFEAGERRRYPVGVLQKAKPAETPADVDMGEFSEDTKQEVSDAMIDPSLDALVVDDKSAHCELINSLRAYIQELLRAEEKREKEGGDLIVADEALAQPEDGDHAMTDAPSAPATEAEDASSNSANDGQHQEAQTENTEENKQSEHQTDAQALYPILKAVAAC
ncbi:hypothetical protein FN846DRAFT_961634 [Sphaerosporella brunnea]|uniref:Uncharacterized protein n=1 Tax=Sphaerosporella brunnea TaxID=1250544 RepID=A0A5J5EPK1_9PEZI|nr:hypothetical protein FN846DRAFT_961634 [Sphaerosporella brunnea]